MAGGKFSEAKLHGMTIRESADDGSDFTNPDADYRRLFLGEDGQLHVKDSAGTVTGIGGSIADILDLATAETDDTLVLAPDGAGGVEFRAEAGGGAGTELDYAQITSDVSITGTADGSETTVVTGASVAYANVPVMIQFHSNRVDHDPGSAGDAMVFNLYEDSTNLGRIAIIVSGWTANVGLPVTGWLRRTPSAGNHTYSVRAWRAGAGTVKAGTGGAADENPTFLRVTLV